MKTKVTRQFINQVYDRVFRAGYCDLQHIFWNCEKRFYNCGVYGWNFDVYTDYTADGESIAFTTGYRNMTGERVDSDILRKYDSIARAIIDDYKKPYEERCRELDSNRAAFIAELVKA